MGNSGEQRGRGERRVGLAAIAVVLGLVVAAVAVQFNRGPLGPRPVPELPGLIDVTPRNAQPDPIRWPGLPPTASTPEGEPDVLTVDVFGPGAVVEVTVVDLAARFGGGIVGVGSDDTGVHVFSTLLLDDDGRWTPGYRIVSPWNLRGAVDVPVVIQVDASQETHVLRIEAPFEERVPGPRDVVVGPDAMGNLGDLVALSDEGVTFFLPPGEYREVSVLPRSGQTFVGAAGDEPTVLNGSRIVDVWEERDGLWIAPDQEHVAWGFLDANDRVRANPSDDQWGTCARGRGDVCKLPELLFVDGRPLQRVERRVDVEEGRWYFSYAANEVVLADDPRGKLVELAVTPHAIWGTADDVRIENLVVHKYASPMRQGAIQPRSDRIEEVPGEGWVISGTEVAWNHGYGIKADIGMVVEHSWIHDNFQMGIGAGSSRDVVISRSEISGNCAGSSRMGAMCSGHSGGGVKLDFSNRATLRENFVHGNHPHGLHVDQFSRDATMIGNVTVDNTNGGLHFEISSGALIADNYTAGNGEAGILVISSSLVSVTGNHITENEDAILVRQDERCSSGKPECVRGLRVSQNYVDLGIGTTGLTWSPRRGPDPYRGSADNSFEGNVYVVATGNCRAEPFRWQRSTLDWRAWSRQGLDSEGHIIWPDCIVAGGPGPIVGLAQDP